MTARLARRQDRARGLVELSLVDVLLEALVERLCLEHPALHDFAHGREPREIAQARAVLDHVDGLRLAIDAYVAALAPSSGTREPDDEPF